MGSFKLRAYLNKIFAVDKQRFICLPVPILVFRDCAVFNAGMLSRILRADICQVDGSILVIIHADQQYLPVKFIKLPDRRSVSENIGKIVV